MKDLFLYDTDIHNATKELDKVDLSKLLSKCRCISLSNLQTYISDEYPQLEKHLDMLDDAEFMMYFQDRYNATFNSRTSYYLVNTKE